MQVGDRNLDISKLCFMLHMLHVYVFLSASPVMCSLYSSLTDSPSSEVFVMVLLFLFQHTTDDCNNICTYLHNDYYYGYMFTLSVSHQ